MCYGLFIPSLVYNIGYCLLLDIQLQDIIMYNLDFQTLGKKS